MTTKNAAAVARLLAEAESTNRPLTITIRRVMENLQSYFPILGELSLKAGAIARRHYNSQVEFERKSDDSPVTKADRERLKQASRVLLKSLQELLKAMANWTQNATTQAEVKVCIVDSLWQALPRPPFTDDETEVVAGRVYDYVWQRSRAGHWGQARQDSSR